jgi:hypothetical protein
VTLASFFTFWALGGLILFAFGLLSSCLVIPGKSKKEIVEDRNWVRAYRFYRLYI